MKIKKAVTICERSGVLTLCEGKDVQWITDGGAAYPMYAAPRFDEASICSAYDIGSSKVDKMVITHVYDLPRGVNCDDFDDGETQVEEMSMRIVQGGRELIPYETSDGITFLDAQYLRPLSDTDRDVFAMYERRDTAGRIYFAAKAGMVLIGIIMPVQAINDRFCDQLATLANRCRVALDNGRPTQRREDDEQ